MNSFGRIFRVTLFGESHGQIIGVVLDGVSAGIPLSANHFTTDMNRRRSSAAGSTPRRESDIPNIISGLLNGYTTGAPLTIMFNNENQLSSDYSGISSQPRPSHSDRAAIHKWHGYADLSGGGHLSGRMTLAIVAAGVVAKAMIKHRSHDINFHTRITEIGGCEDVSQFDNIVSKAMEEGDSVGGIVECIAEGIPAGLGEPFFDSAESMISHLLFSIPAVKGVEFGRGFNSARIRGSENNDPIISVEGNTLTNNAGGINGGITNGNPLIVRAAIKPTPSISATQNSINMTSGKMEDMTIQGRHDACIALRAEVAVEAATAIAIAEFILINRAISDTK